MDSSALSALGSAMAVMENQGEPQPLVELANRIQVHGTRGRTDQEFARWLDSASPGDSLLMTLGRLLAGWDGVESANWTQGTDPNSRRRRDVIYHQLDLDESAQQRIDRLRPIIGSGTTVVAEPFERWFDPLVPQRDGFYWPRYRDYLLVKKGWSLDTVNALDAASNDILQRLADPMAEEARSQRGLVMGYVQSGKTANLSAVIAKAIDIGYRFVIVMTGIHEALRKQTQRRLDMEVIGKPNIEGEEYSEDPSWLSGGFSDLGGALPTPEIQRLTTQSTDFNKHLTHTLRFKPNGQAGRLYERDNLFPTPVRIAVIKKNSAVMNHLLRAMKANRQSMDEVPTLIIDDESDQASINTTKPTWRSGRRSTEEGKERKAINKAISNILEVTPRSQYIGYTATPFANVFVDPDDEKDIFPRDFIISLPEPIGYMGASSFFNSVQPADAQYELDNKKAYIRELTATDQDTATQGRELQRAIAAFIVAGAIKLYRGDLQPSLAVHYHHHTMLVHEAAQKSQHQAVGERLVSIWKSSEWLSVAGKKLLREAFEDYRPTLEDRADPIAPFVEDFDLLEPYFAQVVERVESRAGSFERRAKNVVTVVNSDAQVTSRLDFNRGPTWKIIVGGAMLSRGFTIEGLTISYFRRSPQAHDTLLQMGRWFGYRPGYRDLVRIYLAANTAISKRQLVNLYDAFDMMAESEAEFREQLALYARWEGDRPAITPKQVVPLVTQALPWLKPTAANKMYNAKIVTQREEVFSPKAPAMSKEAVADNWVVTEPLLRIADRHVDINRERPGERHVPAECGVVPASTITAILKGIEYLPERYEAVVQPKVAYYDLCIGDGLLRDFLVLFPQLIKGKGHNSVVNIPGLGTRTLARRTRNAKEEYGELTDPEHRNVAESYLGVNGRSCPPELEDVKAPARGVILAYLIPERGSPPDDNRVSADGVKPEECTVGLTIYLPSSALDPVRTKRVTWQGMSDSSGV